MNFYSEISDENIYLEDIDGAEALKWIANKNKATISRLRNDPRYAELEGLMKAAAAHSDRIVYPFFSKPGQIDNYWIDDVNLRGIWRTTDRDDYFNGKPDWCTLLDMDALAAKEGRNWVYSGGARNPFNLDRFLLYFSDGGKDAVTIREFDAATKQFVPGGFDLPEAKQSACWGEDPDTIYVSRDWGGGN